MSAETILKEMTDSARKAAKQLARSNSQQRMEALLHSARALNARKAEILAANAQDLAALPADTSPAFRDRLTLTEARIDSMAQGIEAVARLPDPVGQILAEWERPNGLHLRRVAVPIGIIAMIYESRPNVGADAAALCIRSGNAVLLRGGAETLQSARAIHGAIEEGLHKAGLDIKAVQIFPSADRALVGALLQAVGQVDLVIPRGGKGLVERVQKESRIPVLAHAAGLCHTYVHKSANPDMARCILRDAKLRRPGICGATETLLIDAAIAPSLLPQIVSDLASCGCEFRADDRARSVLPDLPAAQKADFATEWLGPVLSVAVVDDIEDALAHIARYSTAHSEAIIARDEAVAEQFFQNVDSAIIYWNASTQFSDGGEFGFGAEIGISTGRLHARGPVGPEQLMTYRYEIRGDGQIRG